MSNIAVNKMKKHLFIVPLHDSFLHIFIANAIFRDVFPGDDVCVFYFDAQRLDSDKAIIEFNRKKNCYDNKVEVDFVKNEESVDFSSFLSISFLSLNKFNSSLVYYLVTCGSIDTNRINIIITDDEIDRWNKLKNLEGKLVPSDKYHVDEYLIYSLGIINNFLQLRKPWGDLLENILNRKVNAINYFPLFSILSYEDQSKLFNLCGNDIQRERLGKKKVSILLFTKPKGNDCSIRWLLAFLKKVVFNNIGNNQEIEIGLWSDCVNKDLRVLMLCYLIKLSSKASGRNFHFTFLKKMPASIYFLNLIRYDFLVAQPRGGGSTIREFWNYSGEVIFYKDSMNSTVYKKNFHSKYFEFEEISSAVDYMLNGKNLAFDNSRRFASEIVDLQDESIEKLKNFYSNF